MFSTYYFSTSVTDILAMHTKKRKYTDNISVAFDKDLKNKIIELATEANISQGEFVRDAVEHYISYLKSKVTDEDKTYEQLAEELIKELEDKC